MKGLLLGNSVISFKLLKEGNILKSYSKNILFVIECAFQFFCCPSCNPLQTHPVTHTKVFLPLDSKSSKNATDVVKDGRFPSLAENFKTSETG